MAQIEEVVHIIPLGHEYDRAIRPFETRTADRIYVLTVTDRQKYAADMIERQEYFTKKVVNFLKSKHYQVITKDVDLFDILEVMKNVANIILHEKNLGNKVHVNMSACGRLTSVGATLAGMAQGANVYYVSAGDYALDKTTYLEHGLSVCSKSTPFRFENFQLAQPDYISKKILVELYSQPNGMNTRDIRKMLRESDVEGFKSDTDSEVFRHMAYNEKRLEQIKQLMKLEKRYLQGLERNGYISRIRSGRNNIISITDSGRYIACISGLIPESIKR